jgi:hypothetical protein
MIATNTSSNNPKIERPFPPAAVRPPPITRAERIWNLHRAIINPISKSGEVRRSKRALLVALATPDKLVQAELPVPQRRTRQESRHSQRSPFSVEAVLL